VNNTAPVIVLVGLMGTGKSTVAWDLSKHYQVPCLDTDKLVEQRVGRSVREIFDESGEHFFREIESEVLRECIHSPGGAVIAAAGGVVLADVNRELMKNARDQGKVTIVWLHAPPELLALRTMKGSHRPALDTDRLAVLQKMFTQREPLYKEVSDVLIDVSERSIESVTGLIIDAMDEAMIWDDGNHG
jgi:shikimate kinase